ncbi:hypothetical protein GLOIN_2v1778859 [Rhizophagus clarus]|uniref:Uncharacterized protein n=1 Tax=Rhizophagus clarus TaxID=94130 RepID=A0A8H3R167_9GLOM|nr:hypothetical protein GLOIN_2v1778859 [Rhizophagus clarus]
MSNFFNKGRVIEGVENINSINTGGTSTASTESQGTLNNSQPQSTAGLEASIHAQAHTATTITAISNLALSQNNTEKKNPVFHHVVGLTRIFSTTTIKGIKMIKVVCETENTANKVMAKTIVVNNSTKFMLVTFANKDLVGALKEECIDDMNATKENHFAFNNKGLHFADKNALTCHTAYQDIYKRYKVEASKLKSGFKPIFSSVKNDFIPSDMNWADDWDAEFSAKPTLPINYAKVIQRSLKFLLIHKNYHLLTCNNKTGFNPKSNCVFSKDITSNIP